MITMLAGAKRQNMFSVYLYFRMTTPEECVIFGLYIRYLVESKIFILITLYVIVNADFIGHYKISSDLIVCFF